MVTADTAVSGDQRGNGDRHEWVSREYRWNTFTIKVLLEEPQDEGKSRSDCTGTYV